MNKYVLGLTVTLMLLLGLTTAVSGQNQFAYRQEGEFGIGVGIASYFGDLKAKSNLGGSKPAAGIFYRKNFGNYIAARIGVNYARLGYSDVRNTNNPTMVNRNLSFNSDVWEVALQGDFNFFRFLPGELGYNFTPYVTLGIGAFSYDPYAYYQGEKVFLRPLGTEGQGHIAGRKQYGAIAMSIPIGGGIKYAINDRFNIGFELLHRITSTDYLDDVSTQYVDPAIFPSHGGAPSLATYLHDRSYELGPPIGTPGRQRGNSKQKDQFLTAMIHLTFNIQSYRCPTGK